MDKWEFDTERMKTMMTREHMRMRPGMYVGRVFSGIEETSGIYLKFFNLLDNFVKCSNGGNTINVTNTGEAISVSWVKAYCLVFVDRHR